MIRWGEPPRESTVRQIARSEVPTEDLHRFVEMAFGELLNLHEGNIARYRLSPSVFRTWKKKWAVGSGALRR